MDEIQRKTGGLVICRSGNAVALYRGVSYVDLVPRIVPGYKPPFRLPSYGVRSTVGGKEATSLRRLARVIPPHFALGLLLSFVKYIVSSGALFQTFLKRLILSG
ncbi:hypothetical protein AgCh_007535 [Apium graveolens]